MVADLVLIGSNSQACLAIVQEKVIMGLMKSLGEVKKSCSSVKLATRHVLLIVVISPGGNSSQRAKARVLGVHHCNISHVIMCRKVMDLSNEFQWSLSIWNRRSDVLSLTTKVVMGQITQIGATPTSLGESFESSQFFFLSMLCNMIGSREWMKADQF